MFRNVPIARKILEAYRKLPFSGLLPLTPEMQPIIDEADKSKKAQASSFAAPTPIKKRKIKKTSRRPRSPTASDNEGSQSNSDVRIGGDEQIQNEDTARTSQPEVSQSISLNLEVTVEIPVLVPFSTNFIENVSILSLTTIVSMPTCHFGNFANPTHFHRFHHDTSNIC
ncbi:unnamed protein product [Lactuca saligna]|uniref:Uncharacterized protein n=1 Tax=Lactuca saligna TaxID=75948 RepID=A0AA36EB30_LACSI|nr:unnamed protein product [Lactuca saligna]